MNLCRELRALDGMNNSEFWMTWITLGRELKALDAMNNSRLSDATHGSLALKAYQQNLYLEYYY